MKLRRIIALTIAILLLSGSVAYMETDDSQTAAPAVDSMKKVAENDYLRLYIDEATTAAAVQDKRTGYTWYTNPVDRESDTKAASLNKDKLNSQISISYYTPTAQVKKMNNYTDSIKYGQFDIVPIDNGVRINYRIGKEEKIYILPQRISKQRMEEKIIANLKDADGKTLLRNYRALTLEGISEKRREELLAEFPTLANGDLYVLSDNLRDFLKVKLEQIVVSSGYTLEDMNEDHLANSLPEATANPEVFKVPLEYILDGENLVARIPTGEIEYTREYPIYDLQLLEFFGAAGLNDNGYMLVPDGSGSLIYLNNNKLSSQSYAIDVYGIDRSIPMRERTSIIEQAYLPVFGLKKGDNAFFAVIENGDAMSKVWADISGHKNSYNNVFSEYILIQNDQLDIGDYSGNNTIMVYQPRIFNGDIKVRYAFLNGNQADYSGMAAWYRNYLVKNYGLTREQPKDHIPFYLEVIGAITKVKSILGIPVNTIQPLTTYKQTIDILKLLDDADISNIILRYKGWANGGVDHTNPAIVKLISRLGGKSGFNKLNAYVKEKGIGLYPEFGIIYNYKDTMFDGFNPRAHASRYITKLVARIFNFNLATQQEDPTRGVFHIISPARIPAIVNGMIKGLKKLNITGISLRDAAIDVNSDFKENKLIDRQEASDIVAGELKKIKDSGLSVMVDGGNSYALSYTDHILNIPDESNLFHMTDESVPFFQMAIRGYIDYAGGPINMSPDYKKAFLKAVETGSGIHFSFIYAENSVVKETIYDQYYSNEYRVWLQDALDFYKKADEAMGDVQGQTIAEHKKLAEGVFKTTYEKGKEIIVNYNTKPVEADGITVDAMSFKVAKEGE